MDRRTVNRDNLIMAARNNKPAPYLDAKHRQAQVIEALKAGNESKAEIARRFGVTPRSVSKLYVRKVRDTAPPPPPEIIAAEERLAEATRQGEQSRLIALSQLYDAMSQQCMRDARALDKDQGE